MDKSGDINLITVTSRENVIERIHSQVWEDAIAKVREHSPASFDTWFAGVQFDGLVDGKLHLRARDEFVRDWIRDHFQPALLHIIEQTTGSSLDVVWTIDSDLDSPVSSKRIPDPVIPRAIQIVEPEPQPVIRESKRPASAAALLGVNPKNTFDNFVVGPSNQLAFAAASTASGGAGRRYNPLFLCGSTGLGKTHLLHAIALRIRSERPSARIAYGSADSFTSEYINSISDRRMDEFRARYHQCDALLIDDVQSLAGRTQTQEEFFNTFNFLHACDKQIVLAADKYPQQLDRMEQRLVSRFTWGLVADVQTPEFETRVAIVRKKAKIENVDLPEEVAVLLAQTVQSNVRELEGMLIRLIAKSSLLGCPLDLSFAEHELSSAQPTRKPTPTVEYIQQVVCRHFHVETSDMLSKARHRSVSRARHIAMFLCRQRLKCSFPEIGRAFANRDHTTVMSAVRKVEAMRDHDPELRAHLEEIERRLSSGE